jgi:hypothetical protein
MPSSLPRPPKAKLDQMVSDHRDQRRFRELLEERAWHVSRMTTLSSGASVLGKMKFKATRVAAVSKAHHTASIWNTRQVALDLEMAYQGMWEQYR